MNKANISIKCYITVNVLQKLADILANSVVTIFLLQKGFSYTDIGIFWSVYLTSVMIFDFPSGVLADYIGRRKTYVYGVLASLASYVALAYGAVFGVITLSYLLKGIGAALMSGSLQAWLGSSESKEKYKKYIGKTKLYEMMVVIPVVLIIGFIKITAPLSIIILVIFIQFLISVLATVFLPENKGIVESFWKCTWGGTKQVIKSNMLMMALLMSFFSYCAFTAFNLMWQPYAEICGLNVNLFPMLSAINTFAASGSSFLISKKNLKANRLNNLSMLIFLLCFVSMIILSESHMLYTVFYFIIVYGIASGISFISLSCTINENTTSENKATIFSVISSLSSLMTIIFQPIIASWVEKSYMYAFTLMTAILSVIFIIYNLVSLKNHLKRDK